MVSSHRIAQMKKCRMHQRDILRDTANTLHLITMNVINYIFTS